jgi:hypothetical protein
MRAKTAFDKDKNNKSGKSFESIHMMVPGLTQDKNVPATLNASEKPKEMTEDEILEENARKAFKTLAEILKKAKEEKHRRMKEEMEQGGLGETQNAAADPKIIINDKKNWLIYPESKFSTLWDVQMAM